MSESVGYPVGHLVQADKSFSLPVPLNSDDLISNGIIVDQQGGGKTNLMMSLVYGYYKLYKDYDGQRGCLPVVMVPKFEWYKMGIESLPDNLAPGQLPESIPTVQVTFPVCNKPEHIPIIEYSIEFGDLSIEDIGSFCGMRSAKDLGEIQGLRETLSDPSDIEEFLEAMWKVDKFGNRNLESKYSGLYYVFSKLRSSGLFNMHKHPLFDWKKLFFNKEPVIINFGKLDNATFQGLGGYLLRKLEELGDHKFNNVVLKKNMIDEAKQKGEKPSVSLTEEDRFFLKYFNVGLFIDEAPKLLTNTTSSTLVGFPATKSFKTISGNDGRKMGFKYTYLITQFLKDVYFSFRKRSDKIWFGNKVSKEDFDFVLQEDFLHRDDIIALLSNKKFFFTYIDYPRYRQFWHNKYRLHHVAKFRVYRSPCGVR